MSPLDEDPAGWDALSEAYFRAGGLALVREAAHYLAAVEALRHDDGQAGECLGPAAGAPTEKDLMIRRAELRILRDLP